MREWLIVVSEYAITIIDILALVIVVIGTAEAFITGIHAMSSSRMLREGREVWLRYARWLVAALTFQLGADIIETSITTEWESLGRIAVIAIIRTLLNYFLERDVEEREHQIAEEVSSRLAEKSWKSPEPA
jgi:uncharacterized membrane protein